MMLNPLGRDRRIFSENPEAAIVRGAGLFHPRARSFGRRHRSRGGKGLRGGFPQDDRSFPGSLAESFPMPVLDRRIRCAPVPPVGFIRKNQPMRSSPGPATLSIRRS
jgi:hypothetical protein